MRLRAVVAIVALFGFAGSLAAVAGCGGLQENAAASVNGTIITKDDVTNRINLLRKTYGAMIPQEDDADRFGNFRKEVTDQLVREQLEKEETQKRNITVSGSEINLRYEELAEESFLSDIGRMKQEYAAKGMTEAEMDDEVRRAILHEKLMESFGKDIVVTDQDAQEYYERNRAQYDQPERRQLRQIVTDNEAAAVSAAQRARSGESFPTVAEQVSIDPEAAEKKGAIGLVSKGQLPPALDAAAWKMQIGEVSAPVQVDQQWYVLFLENTLAPIYRPFEDAREEIKVVYGNQQFSERWRAFVDEVYQKASIEYNPDYDPAGKVDVGTAAS